MAPRRRPFHLRAPVRADARRAGRSTTTSRRARRPGGLTLLCGRYEGIDERVREHLANDAISIGRVRALRRRAGGDGGRGRGLPEAPGRARQRGERRRGVVLAGAGGRPRVPPLHAPAPPTAAGRCRRCSCPGTTSGSELAAGATSAVLSGGAGPESANIRARREDFTGAARTFRRTDPSMSELIDSIERRQLRKELPALSEGDRVRVHFQVVEGTRRRTQVFEGRDKASGRGLPQDLHGPQAFVRGRRRADVPAPLAQGRADRGGRARRGPKGEALLPARPDRPPRARARAQGRRAGGAGGRAAANGAEADEPRPRSRRPSRGRRRAAEPEAEPEAEAEQQPAGGGGPAAEQGEPRPRPSRRSSACGRADQPEADAEEKD